MNNYRHVSKICITVLANVKANFSLNGLELMKPIIFTSDDRASITFIVEDFLGNQTCTTFKITISENREDLTIMDLSYKLLVWLNDLTFDNKYK